MDGRLSGWMDKGMRVHMYSMDRMNGWKNEYIDGKIDCWKDGSMFGLDECCMDG